MFHLLTGPVRQVDAEFPKQEAGPGEGAGSSVHIPSPAGTLGKWPGVLSSAHGEGTLEGRAA